MEGWSDELADIVGIVENTPIAKTTKRAVVRKMVKGFLRLLEHATIISIRLLAAFED
jgi:hypothetical protein